MREMQERIITVDILSLGLLDVVGASVRHVLLDLFQIVHDVA